ncbi:hypothetical protein B6N60_00634 [Richelia sinica FACHB-800]|uniref:DUF350 domain-containing protein n=1 Tax=Richelia sinica FACHB-800 TaxID=1357546 RepID=A0A975T5T5_9NOST|nr:DUF350 domain-containing protein [Richelia sinica]MBD2663089.1 DUF350 domain-containing protein [Richelia sinica FACHB-800]QXE21956.1 hypothetical protein B6N60_00634 [Richelia sinica FACHB-800]
MNQLLIDGFTQSGVVILELAIGFSLFWLGQFIYQKLFRRRIELNLELFVKDNPAVAIALVGYYFGIVIALGGVLGQNSGSLPNKALYLANYGIMVIFFMLAGAWVGDKLILRHFNCEREIIQDRNIGAATVEAGNHIANGLILNAALAGESGGWLVALVSWLIGLLVLVLVSFAYPNFAKYNVFAEIEKRNNPAAGVGLAGLLIAAGNIVRVAFSAEFVTWNISFLRYALVLFFCLGLLIIIRFIADLILVPGVKISDEIVNQEIPNVGAGLIEAFAYIAASFLIAWCF